ncbi:oligosaccharide flippase family protein [Pseudomonas sp. BT-42-2]|uniref:lipopolysaccharide biosynthesis protein n=1 Tax=Pseudomonas sp. BT-42-2 TaxID=2986927 RepID=UPI0021F6EB26|nr:oligosaccharide flippase family protein [Pseudomonas sp. BT-42-2]MCV9919508.1 oligosaccharide flippase family protein [Pseudomonas sp. BT-42-2]
MNRKTVGAFAIGPIGSAVIGFITLPIMTWIYPADEVGRIAMLQIASSFFVLVFCLGLDQAFVRDFHECKDKPKLLLNSMVPGLFLVSFMVLALFVIGGQYLSGWLFGIANSSLGLIAVACLISVFLSRFLSLILRMEEKGVAYSVSQVLPKAIFLLFLLINYLTIQSDSFLFLLGAYSLSLVVVMLLFAWNTRHMILSALAASIDFRQIRTLLQYGSPLILGGAAFWALTTLDRMFLRNFSSFTELGFYSVASNFAAAAIVFQSVFSTVWVPTVYRWLNDGDYEAKIDTVTEKVLVVTFFLFVLTGLFSWLVTYILPPEYNAVQYIVIACMAYPLFYTLSETTVVGINVSKKSIYAMLAAIIAMLFSALGNYVFVPEFGAKGAAVSTASAFWIFLVCRTEFSCHVWRAVPRVRLYCSTLICLIASVCSALLGASYKYHMITGWFILGVVGGIYFSGTLKKIYCEDISRSAQS